MVSSNRLSAIGIEKLLPASKSRYALQHQQDTRTSMVPVFTFFGCLECQFSELLYLRNNLVQIEAEHHETVCQKLLLVAFGLFLKQPCGLGSENPYKF